MATVRHTHTVGTGLTPEQIAEVRAAAKRPYTYDPDCPLLTEEQLAEFRPANGMSWEERTAAMREAGLTALAKPVRERIPAGVQSA